MNETPHTDAPFSGPPSVETDTGAIATRGMPDAPHAPENAPATHAAPVAPPVRTPAPIPTMVQNEAGIHVPIVAPWVPVAQSQIGVKEIAGRENNPKIIAYHAATKLHATTDEVAWCSSFVNWVLAKVHMETTESAAAISWMNWGEPLDEPVHGCIVVLKRTGGNHVAFYMGEREGQLKLLGGNQGDQVKEALFSKKDLLGYRWPKGMPTEPYAG